MIILALGTNIGNKEQNLIDAIDAISAIATIKIESPIYHSEPWGFTSENNFLNMVIAIESELGAIEILAATQKIERNLGRTIKSNGVNYSDRVIDIDIIDYNAKIVDSPTLQLPHPLMHQRMFVLEPLCAIAPEWTHPKLRLTVRELINGLFFFYPILIEQLA